MSTATTEHASGPSPAGEEPDAPRSGAREMLRRLSDGEAGSLRVIGTLAVIWGALLGALVIVSISNGVDLLSLDASIKFMVTGGVLLAAVSADAVTRTRRQAAGRA